MNKITQLLLLLFVVALVSSCSKDAILERKLGNNTWNIDRITWLKTYVGSGGFNVTTGTETNAGQFVLDESTGSSTMTIDGKTETVNFAWSVSGGGEEINLDFDVAIQGGNISVRQLVVVESKKNSQQWVLQEVQVDSSGSYTLQAEMELSK